MSFSKLKLAAVVVLPFVLASATSEAATTKKGATSAASTYAAREKCIAEAQAAYPAIDGQDVRVQTQRLRVYAACAKKMGFRP